MNTIRTYNQLHTLKFKHTHTPMGDVKRMALEILEFTYVAMATGIECIFFDLLLESVHWDIIIS